MNVAVAYQEPEPSTTADAVRRELRSIILDRYHSVEKAAPVLGYKVDWLRNRCNGRTPMRLDEADELAERLGTNLEEVCELARRRFKIGSFLTPVDLPPGQMEFMFASGCAPLAAVG